MKNDKLYINYEDYPVMEKMWSKQEFVNVVSTKVTDYNLNWLTSDTILANKIKLLVVAFANPIYDEYHSDSLAYLDSDTFVDRVINSIVRKVNRWYIQNKIEEGLIDNASLEKFISNGGTHSLTKEDGSTGSAVIQKSASTPTGISHNVSEEDINVGLSHDDVTDNTSMKVNDGYEDKYTNFVGKTNGLHRNEVERDSDITRTSNYGLSLEIIDKIPYSYISSVLNEVSLHFIQVY